MRGVAADEYSIFLETVCDQSPADPVLFRKHLVFKNRSDSENVADSPVEINRLVVGFAVIKKIVNQPAFNTINRHHRAATARIECKIHPGRVARQHAKEGRRAEICRLHPLYLWHSGNRSARGTAGAVDIFPRAYPPWHAAEQPCLDVSCIQSAPLRHGDGD